MFNNLKKVLRSVPTFDLTDDSVPIDPQQFYQNIGLLEHPHTRQPVKKLTSYQLEAWRDAFRYRYRLVVKSQKIGMTTTSLMEDFQRCLLPIEHSLSCRGKEILLIAQTHAMAKEHLMTLQYMIMNSDKYRNYLILSAGEGNSSLEQTKATQLYIYNPTNPKKPTRIIALGPSAASIWSWKNVKHIHMSDVAAIESRIDDAPIFGAAFSRLANTNGTMLIESPPRGQRGKVWDIYKASKLKGDDVYEEAKFKVREYSAQRAVDAGLITEEFLQAERVRLGPLYGQYYECEFMNPYTSWYTQDMIKYDNNPYYVEY